MIEHQHALPEIVQDDVLSADLNNFLEEAIDPTHREEWHKLERANKLLAHFVLKIAYEYSEKPDEQNKFLAGLLRTIGLINIAELRKKTSDDDDGADQPRSSAPDDGPQVL